MPFGWDDAMMGGLGLMSLLFGGGGNQGQERQTFEGETGPGGMSIDPRDLLGQGIGNSSDVLAMLMDRIGQGVNLPGAYAQAPPTLTGGGLPMPIGVTGRDPAVSDPGTHLRLPGLSPRGPNIGPWASGIGPDPTKWNPTGGLYGNNGGANPVTTGGTNGRAPGRTGPTNPNQAADDAQRAAEGRPVNQRAHGHGIDTTTGKPPVNRSSGLGTDLLSPQAGPHDEALAALNLLGVQ